MSTEENPNQRKEDAPSEEETSATAEDRAGEAPAADQADGNGALATSAGEGQALAKEPGESSEEEEYEEVEEEEAPGAPVQLGTQRFVYAAYFAGGITVAFLLSKAASYSWERLSLWKPSFGEPHDEIVLPICALVGAAVAFYYYRDEKTRTMAEEVAYELGQVTWPTRDEVVNGTFVVLLTTLFSTAFFALMDRFWGFVTNLVYGA